MSGFAFALGIMISCLSLLTWLRALGARAKGLFELKKVEDGYSLFQEGFWMSCFWSSRLRV